MEVPPAVERVEVEPGLNLRMELHGRRSDGVPLVLVHGFMGSAAAWGDLPGRLARGRPVAVLDLPGHGGSDRPRDPEVYAVPRIASMLARAVEALDGDGADWLGYSMGGRIVLAGVAEGRLRPRRLVVESASPGLPDEAARTARHALDESRAAALLADGIEPFVDAWLALPLFATQRHLTPAVRARERDRRLGADPAALAACLRGGGTGRQPSYWHALADVDVPTLLLSGGADRKFAELAEAMAARMPRARRVTVPGAGHAVHLEQADAWLEAVEAFLGADRP